MMSKKKCTVNVSSLSLWNNNNSGKLISPLGVKAFAVVQKPRALKCISADRNTLDFLGRVICTLKF